MAITDINKFDNKTFELFGDRYIIKIVDEIKEDDNTPKVCWGCVHTASNEILIARNTNGHKITKNQMYLTLIHEIVHCIFTSGQYTNTCNDEPLVEWTAKCIRHLIKTGIF